MILEIDDDTADRVVQQTLVDTYVSLSRDLKIHKKYSEHLHPDDAVIYKEVVEAIKVLASWFFMRGEFEEAVKKAKKK